MIPDYVLGVLCLAAVVASAALARGINHLDEHGASRRRARRDGAPVQCPRCGRWIR